MRFLLSPEQEQFGASLDELLAAADVPAVAASWAAGDPGPGRTLWWRLAELGVPALATPERWGGLGAHPADLVVAFEALGRHGAPGPVVESMAFVPTLLARLDAPDLADKWLPPLASGASIATCAMLPHVPRALDADVADLLLLADGDTLRFGERAARPRESVDATRRLFDLTPAGPAAVDAAGAIGRAFDVAVLACSAQLLGAGHGLLAATRAHAGRRVQFGRPIGQFQAVRHRLADVLVGLELARPLVYGAAVALADGADTATRDLAAAKIACGDAAYRAARAALQVHGAIGYTEEGGLALLLTKVRALLTAWGTPAVHRTTVMADLAGGEAPWTSR